jgi:mRNA interferase RelE/StbE
MALSREVGSPQVRAIPISGNGALFGPLPCLVPWPAARRAIAQRLPETVAAAVVKFCEAALAVNPHRVGKPLFGPLADCHGARRGTYRIDEDTRTVHVLDIGHRAEIYRSHS